MDETLTYEQCERFYSLRDAFAVVARLWLGMEGDILVSEDPPLFDEELLRDTLDEALAAPAVIDRFVRENPLGFSADELEVVGSWKASLDANFVLFEHAGMTLLLYDGRVFHVLGLYEPIVDVVGCDLPAIVQTRLVPFDGRIVHYGFFTSWPIEIGPAMLRAIKSDIAQALKSGVHVIDADHFAELVPVIAEERIKRDAERMVEELELDMRAAEQLPGHHVGVLAGMDEASREAAIREHADSKLSNRPAFDFEAYLKGDTTKGPVRCDLAGLIGTELKEKLRRWAWAYGLPHGTSLTKAELVDELVPKLSGSDFFPTIALQGLMPDEFACFRKLHDEGGLRRMKVADITTLKDVPPVLSLLCYQFREDDSFVFVIPDEIMGVLEGFDWDGCERTVLDFRRSAHIADALCALRGIVTIEEAYEEFKRCYSGTFGFLDFDTGVRAAMERDYAAYDLLEADDGEVYLLHYEIGNQFRREHGIEEEDFPDPYLEGDLGSLEMFLQGHEGKVARTLDEGVRTLSDVFSWRQDRPAVRALRDYLDGHVPDGADDYYFADGVIEDLIKVMSAGLANVDTIPVYFDVLVDHGLRLDEAHLRKVTDLLMNMANSIPTWMNNGWAPQELHEAATGKKVFYNDDGSVIKVGRNDPCPCGSGKKYKKCCGR